MYTYIVFQVFDMKKILSTILATSLVASTLNFTPIINQAAYAATQNNNPEQTKSVTDLSKYENNQVIVVYKKNANATEEKTLGIASLNATEEEHATVDELTDNSVVLSLDSEDALEDAIQSFSSDSRVEYIQPNYIYHTLDNSDSILHTMQQNSDFTQQWALNNDGTGSYEEYDYETILTSNKKYNYDSDNYPTIQITAKEDVDIDLPEAWNALSGSTKATGTREAVVAFVDTGVMYDHVDLTDSMWTNDAELNGEDGVDDDNNGYIDDVYGWNFYGSGSYSWFGESETAARPGFNFGDWFNPDASTGGNNTYYNANSSTEDAHGTHGAGTVAAVNNTEGIVGIGANANVKIMSVKALGGSDGTGTTASVVKGIQYAVDNGATIINLSLGGDEDDESLRDIIKDNPNVLFTIAAGNGDSNYKGIDNDSTPTYPACYNYDNMLCVANLQCDGTLHYSSNYGATTVHLAAPGSNIYSTSTGNESDETSYSLWGNSSPAVSGYEHMTGTSMAAPMVAGVAAMLYSKYDTCTIQSVREAILKSVDTDSNKYASLQKKVSSNGVLNAYRAVEYIEKNFDSLASPTLAPTKAANTPTPTPKTTATPTASNTPQVTDSAAPSQEPVATNTPDNGDHNPSPTTTATNTPTRTNNPTNTNAPTKSNRPTNTNVPSRTNIPLKNTVEPTNTPLPDKNTQTPVFTNIPTTSSSGDINGTTNNPSGGASASTSALSLSYIGLSSKTLYIGKNYTITTEATGGSGHYTYNFFVTKGGTSLTQSSNKNTFNWTPTVGGIYSIIVYVTDDSGHSFHATTTVSVKAMSITSVKYNKTLKKGATVKFTVKVNSGISPYKYTFTIYRNGRKVLSRTVKKQSVTYTIKKTGTYKIKVTVKDTKGNSASKTITKKVKR